MSEELDNLAVKILEEAADYADERRAYYERGCANCIPMEQCQWRFAALLAGYVRLAVREDGEE